MKMSSERLVTIRSTRASKAPTGVNGRCHDMIDLARSSGLACACCSVMHVLVVFSAYFEAWMNGSQGVLSLVQIRKGRAEQYSEIK